LSLRGAPSRLLALLVTLLGLALPTGASGHAIVLESTPAHDARLEAPPSRVVLRFNGRIEHSLSRVTIERAAERGAAARPVPAPVATGAPDVAPAPDRLVIPLAPLSPGVYVVRYRVLAADGHLTEGALRFTVRAAQ
jgi:methionine-rich copper-binding protein CopC